MKTLNKLLLFSAIAAKSLFGSDAAAQTSPADSIVFPMDHATLTQIRNDLYNAKPDSLPLFKETTPQAMPSDTVFWGEIEKDAEEYAVSDILTRASAENKTHFVYRQNEDYYGTSIEALGSLADAYRQTAKEIGLSDPATTDVILVPSNSFEFGILENKLHLSATILQGFSAETITVLAAHEQGHTGHSLIVPAAVMYPGASPEKEKYFDRARAEEFMADSVMGVHRGYHTGIRALQSIAGWMNATMEGETDPEIRQNYEEIRDEEYNFGNSPLTPVHPATGRRVLYLLMLEENKAGATTVPAPFHFDLPKPGPK